MIAFASDRNGNFDVFVMPSSGGEAKRLTFSSNKEIPCCFTANNKDVMFSAYRQDLATNAQFPLGGLFSELYTVPVAGGKVSMLLTHSRPRSHTHIHRRQTDLRRYQRI